MSLNGLQASGISSIWSFSKIKVAERLERQSLKKLGEKEQTRFAVIHNFQNTLHVHLYQKSKSSHWGKATNANILASIVITLQVGDL